MSCVCVYIYMDAYMHICVYINIYIERQTDRQTDRERGKEGQGGHSYLLSRNSMALNVQTMTHH